MLTNSVECISNLSICKDDQILLSDHYVVTFQISHSSPPSLTTTTTPKYVFDFPKADYDGICSYLIDFDYSCCLRCSDVELVWNTVKSSIYEAMNIFIPKVRLRRFQYPCWFTPELRHLSKSLRTLRKKASRKPTAHLCNKVAQYQSTLRDKILHAKSQYEINLVQSFAGSQSSKICKYIHSLTKDSSIPSTVFLGTSSASQDTERAELFNSFFHSVFTISSYRLPSLDNLPVASPSICSISISELEVLTALSSLDPNKSMGCDGIGSKLLKHCSLALYIPLHHLYSLSISKHIVPLEWKHHSITPVYKSGDKSQVINYRPISLLCIISKVLERLVYDKLSAFIMKHNIIHDSQFGFLQHRPAIQQLLTFLANIHNDINSNARCDVIYLDFRKAFDSVPHHELLLKLRKVGVNGSLWYWFRAYLLGRQQHVSISGCSSSSLPVISGVPQGSILGPLLFLIYINDLPSSSLFTKLFLFADDTKCLSRISSPSDSLLLQSDLDGVSSWSKKWLLAFNETKLHLLSINTKRSNPLSTSTADSSYYINGRSIAPCNSHKDLGIVIASDLKWTDHLHLISSKAYKKLGLLRRTFCATNSISTKKRLYISLVRSQLLYGSQIWRPVLIKDINLIESIQRRATKYILNDYTSDYKARLTKLHLLPLSVLFELHDICFFIKSLKSDANSSFNIVNFVSFNTNQTRSGSHMKLVQPLSKHSRDKQFYFNRLPSLWNSLPAIDLTLSYKLIKHRLKVTLWNHFLANFNPESTCSFHYSCPCSKCSTVPRTVFTSL